MGRTLRTALVLTLAGTLVATALVANAGAGHARVVAKYRIGLVLPDLSNLHPFQPMSSTS